MRILYTLVFVFVGSESIAAIIGSRALWGLRKNSLAKYAGVLLSGIAVGQMCELVANFARPVGVHYSAWFVGWWAAARVARSVGVWALVLYLVGVSKNGHSH
jgi:hypothetical protein